MNPLVTKHGWTKCIREGNEQIGNCIVGYIFKLIFIYDKAVVAWIAPGTACARHSNTDGGVPTGDDFFFCFIGVKGGIQVTICQYRIILYFFHLEGSAVYANYRDRLSVCIGYRPAESIHSAVRSGAGNPNPASEGVVLAGVIHSI